MEALHGGEIWEEWELTAEKPTVPGEPPAPEAPEPEPAAIAAEEQNEEDADSDDMDEEDMASHIALEAVRRLGRCGQRHRELFDSRRPSSVVDPSLDACMSRCYCMDGCYDDTGRYLGVSEPSIAQLIYGVAPGWTDLGQAESHRALSASPFFSLPEDVLHIILIFVEPRTLLSAVPRVCRLLAATARQENFWRNVCRCAPALVPVVRLVVSESCPRPAPQSARMDAGRPACPVHRRSGAGSAGSPPLVGREQAMGGRQGTLHGAVR
jgi:hypothetical protein